MKTKKSFATPVTKRNDIAYRLKRSNEVTDQLEMFIRAVSPDAVGLDNFAAALDAIEAVRTAVAVLEANMPPAASRKKTPTVVGTAEVVSCETPEVEELDEADDEDYEEAV